MKLIDENTIEIEEVVIEGKEEVTQSKAVSINILISESEEKARMIEGTELLVDKLKAEKQSIDDKIASARELGVKTLEEIAEEKRLERQALAEE